MSQATVGAPLVQQGRGGGLREVAQRRFLLSLLVRKELRVRYRSSLLGLGWSYVKPAVQFIVYFVGMGLILQQRSIGNFAVYLFSGLVVVTTFNEAVGNATRSVVVNADLVKKIYLPRELFPVASLCVAAVHLAPQLVVLVAGATLAGWRPDLVGVGALLVALLLVFLLALG
ncbi:MAG TPA: ABC transporter permease, partial [Intrasporangium sp.]|nr:ABC transporter permease [Intrasporangium sp.]